MTFTERLKKSREIFRILKEGQNIHQIFQIEEEWRKALKKLNGYLTPEYIIDENIIYNPNFWYIPGITIGIDQKKIDFWFRHGIAIGTDKDNIINFSTPNKKIPFDIFPGEQAKLGAIAHIAGHLVDKQQYYTNDWENYRDRKTFISNDQRANLRVMHTLPNALYENTRQLIISNFRCLGINPKLGEYEEPLATMEFLGRAGLPRKDNLIGFLKYINDEKELSLDRYLEVFWTFALAGLAVPPSLNHEKKYGVRTWKELHDIDHEVARYIRGEITEPPNTITCIDDYDPECSVDLRGINKTMALNELDQEISVWESKLKKYDGFRCFEEMCESLKRMYIRVRSL
jgi:hypothetical protein